VIARIADLLHLKVAPTTDQLLRQLDPAKYLGPARPGPAELRLHGVPSCWVSTWASYWPRGHGFERKIVGLFPNRRSARRRTRFLRIRNGVEQYLGCRPVTGLMIAVGLLDRHGLGGLMTPCSGPS
jgi:hypothetical protein